jgi:hypothetical protein
MQKMAAACANFNPWRDMTGGLMPPPTAQFVVFAITVLMIYGIYMYSSDTRAADTAWLCFGAFLTLSLLWGAFAPIMGTIRIPLPSGDDIQLWHLAGIGTTVWVIVTLLLAKLRRSRSRR